jgi:hypothetical protein
MHRRKTPAKVGPSTKAQPIRIDIADWEWLRSQSWHEHSGQPGKLARAILADGIARRRSDQPDSAIPRVRAGQDPHAAVRRAMLALPDLSERIDLLASAKHCNREDLANIHALAEKIADGVRGYVRFKLNIPSDGSVAQIL